MYFKRHRAFETQMAVRPDLVVLLATEGRPLRALGLTSIALPCAGIHFGTIYGESPQNHSVTDT